MLFHVHICFCLHVWYRLGSVLNCTSICLNAPLFAHMSMTTCGKNVYALMWESTQADSWAALGILRRTKACCAPFPRLCAKSLCYPAILYRFWRELLSFRSEILMPTADWMLYQSTFPASLGVLLMPCPSCDYPEQGGYGFVALWKEKSALPVVHINSVLINSVFMLNWFLIQTSFLSWFFLYFLLHQAPAWNGHSV